MISWGGTELEETASPGAKYSGDWLSTQHHAIARPGDLLLAEHRE